MKSSTALKPNATKQLIKLTQKILEDNLAIDITILDVRELTDLFDSMIICSATSKRHALALTDKLVQASKQANFRPFNVEGENTGEWVLIDLVDIVVHIMLPETRSFYNLEKLWGGTLSETSEHAN